MLQRKESSGCQVVFTVLYLISRIVDNREMKFRGKTLATAKG